MAEHDDRRRDGGESRGNYRGGESRGGNRGGQSRGGSRSGGSRGDYRGGRDGDSRGGDRRGEYRGGRDGDSRGGDRRGEYRGSRDGDSRGDRREYRGGRDGESRGGNRGGNYRGDRDGDFRGGRGGDRRGGGGGGRSGGPDRRHSNRGGREQDDRRGPRTGPERPGFREERLQIRANEPDLPEDVKADELDPSVRQDLRSLSKDNATAVARHMVMAAGLLGEDPQLALRHARAAKDRAGRVGVVRETNGVAAYHAGEWREALSELRAARRMSGGPGMLAVMADCERGLGRPEKAIEMGRSEEAKQLSKTDRTELAIVVAGARRDMGDLEEAVLELEMQDLNPDRKDAEAVRLFYAYADALAEVDRNDEAADWFQRVVALDPEGELDADLRVSELKGE